MKNRPGDSSQEPIRQSRDTDATNFDAAALLTPGSVYTGRVKARQTDGTYTIDVEDPVTQVLDARLAMPVVGGLMGFNVRAHIPQRTMVKFAYGDPSFIYAVIPDKAQDWLNAQTRSIVWGAVADREIGVTDLFGDHAEDLLEGECEIGNLHGVSLDLLTTLMRMRAGDRAAVECHLINDMVRIISGQWRHISGMGEELIFDHGRPTKERTWSMYRHEVMGAEKENEPFATLKGDEVDREELEAKRVTAQGRHRFREFLGFAGDFIHSFVSDPPKTIVELAKAGTEDKLPGGKNWIHRNSDGTVIIQSVTDIRLERVCRIPVPVRIANHEDPDVTSKRVYDQLESEYLAIPKAASPIASDPFTLAYHIRSYSRWMSRYHAFARMLQLSKDYEVPAESDCPAPSWTNFEEDRAAKNPWPDPDNPSQRIVSYDTYACITILRDGSIVTHDGYGSAIVMSNGNVQVSAARHLDLEAAGDIRLVAGGSILARARRNIELSASIGGLILKSYAWIKGFCEAGSVWLRSNAITDKDEAPQPKGATPTNPEGLGGPVAEIAGWNLGANPGTALLLEAGAGVAALRASTGMTIAVDQPNALNVTTQGNLNLFGRNLAALHSQRAASIGGVQTVAISAPSVISNASQFYVGPNRDEPFIAMAHGQLYCWNIRSKILDATTIRGGEVGPIVPYPDPQPDLPMKRHFNHIMTLDEDVEAPDPPADSIIEALEEAIEVSGVPPELPWDTAYGGPRWGYPENSEYAWDGRENVAGLVPETITQQNLRLDDTIKNPSGGDPAVDRWGGPGYEDWIVYETLSGPRVEARGGFGANEIQYQASDEGEALHKLSTTPAKDTQTVETSWLPKGGTGQWKMKVLKRPE